MVCRMWDEELFLGAVQDVADCSLIDAEALNEETAEILEKEDDTNDEAAVETLLHDDSETEKQKEVE